MVELREAVDYITNHTATWISSKQLRLEMAKRTPLFFFPKLPRPQRFPISLNSASILEFLPLFLLLPTNHHQILRAQHAARTGPLLLFQSKPGPCSGLPAVLLFLFRPSHQPDAGRCRSGHATSLPITRRLLSVGWGGAASSWATGGTGIQPSAGCGHCVFPHLLPTSASSLLSEF